MLIRFRSRTWAPCLLALSGILGSTTHVAHAHSYWGGGYGYGYGYGYDLGYGSPIGMPVAWPGPNYLFVHHQYFELTVSGLKALCQAEPLLCDSSEQAESLRRLQRRRALGVGLSLGGFGIALGVPLGVTLAACSGSHSTCRPDWRIMTGGVLGGAVIGIVGSLLTPSQTALVGYVNALNRAHPGTPITIHPSLVGGVAPGLLINAAY